MRQSDIARARAEQRTHEVERDADAADIARAADEARAQRDAGRREVDGQRVLRALLALEVARQHPRCARGRRVSASGSAMLAAGGAMLATGRACAPCCWRTPCTLPGTRVTWRGAAADVTGDATINPQFVITSILARLEPSQQACPQRLAAGNHKKVPDRVPLRCPPRHDFIICIGCSHHAAPLVTSHPASPNVTHT